MRVWVIRGGRDNRLVDEFVDREVIGVGYATIPDARALTRPDIERLLREEGTSAAVEWHAEMLTDFVHRIAVRDIVIMPDTPRGEIVIGEVAGDYGFYEELPAERYRHRRPMRWLGRHSLADLPPGRENLYRQRPTLMELAQADDLLAHAARVRQGKVGRPPTDRRTSSGLRRAPSAAEPHRRERRCQACFLMLAISAFPSPDAASCRNCSDQ